METLNDKPSEATFPSPETAWMGSEEDRRKNLRKLQSISLINSLIYLLIKGQIYRLEMVYMTTADIY